jgi:hypothetical protein
MCALLFSDIEGEVTHPMPTFSFNRGKPRVIIIPTQSKVGVKVHRSVKIRMEASHPKGKKYMYIPGPTIGVEPTWVD